MKTGIKIKTAFFPLAFLLYFVTPVIEINGKKYSKKWGEYFFELLPGSYNIKIYFKYLWVNECGANEVKVTINEGETRHLSFHMPPWIYAKGRMELR